MYAIALIADQATLGLKSDLVALQKILVDLKLVLNAGKPKCKLFSNSHRNISDGLNIYGSLLCL
jgi:hypothetical protein